MGFFNFGSKKKEANKGNAADGGGFSSSSSQSAAPMPPPNDGLNAPPALGGSRGDDLDLPPLPESFSGSSDLHPEKENVEEELKDPSLLEINSEDLEADIGNDQPSIPAPGRSIPEPEAVRTPGSQPLQSAMPPPPSADSIDLSEHKKAFEKPQFQKMPQPQPVQSMPEPANDIPQPMPAQPSRQYATQRQAPQQPTMQTAQQVPQAMPPAAAEMPPPVASGPQPSMQMPTEEDIPPPEPMALGEEDQLQAPAAQPDENIQQEQDLDEPTKPLELDTPPVPDTLNFDEMDDFTNDQSQEPQQEDQRAIPDSGLDDSEMPQPPSKEDLDFGIEKLDLRDENPGEQPMGQEQDMSMGGRIDLTSTDFGSEEESNTGEDNLFQTRETVPEPQHQEIPRMRMRDFSDQETEQQAPVSFQPHPIEPPEPRIEDQPIEINKKIMRSADGRRPLFLDLLSFRNIVDVLDSFNNETKLAEDTLYRLNDLNDSETDQYKKWQKTLEELERDIINIDRTLFKV